MKGFFSNKKIIISLILVVIMIVLFSTKFNPIRLLSSTYNMNQLEESIGKIKIGDFIDYEINGYSNWQVVSIDKENNTLDVVSRENVEDITLETKDDYLNALDTFQETANKYTDNNLAIKARSVTRADLSNFAFDEEFWNADMYDGAIAYTSGKNKYFEDVPEDGHIIMFRM